MSTYHLKISSQVVYDFIANRDGGNKRLYDMIDDPKETTNLAGDNQDIVEQMEALMSDGWREALPENPITEPVFIDKKSIPDDYSVLFRNLRQKGKTLIMDTRAFKGEATVDLYILSGRSVFSTSVSPSESTVGLQVRDKRAGLYLLWVSVNGLTLRQKIIIR